jgi:hypothetical protein
MNNTIRLRAFVGFLCRLNFAFLVQYTSTLWGYSHRDLPRKLWYHNMYLYVYTCRPVCFKNYVVLMSSHMHCVGMYQDTHTVFQLPSRCHAPLSSFPYTTEFFFLTAFYFGSNFCVRPPSCSVVLRISPVGLQLQNVLRPHALTASGPYGVAFRSVPSQNHAKVFFSGFAKLRKVNISFVISARLSVHLSAWNSSAPTGRFFLLN